jgi:putative RecB family exonuclease
MTFTNTHLSFSRVQRYEQCAQSFKFHYVDKLPSTPGPELKFGKAIHWVLDQLVRAHVDADLHGPLSMTLALALWQRAWTDEGLVGVGLYAEGEEILKAFIRNEGVVDPYQVLAIEKAFAIEIGRFKIVGAIDRIDVIDSETVRVRDYKTNRLIFARDEVDESLQLSLYETERDQTFAPRLNSNCIYCDHRTQCDAYANALRGKRDVVAVDLNDLESVAREREAVARIAKIAYARKSELEDILKTRLAEHEKLDLAGVRYQLQNACSVEYPLEPTLRVLEDATGLSRADLVTRLASIEKDALQALLKEIGAKLPRPRVTLLKAELDARAKKTFTPRFNAKEVRP